MRYLTLIKQYILSWWSSLQDSTRYDLWFALGICWLLFSSWLAYRFYRWSAGHRRHRGTWYTPFQYAELMQILEERQLVQVLKHEDFVALRAWKYGATIKPVFGNRKYGGYSD